MKFQIPVGRTSTRYIVVPVEANSLAEAKEKAEEDAPNHDFSEGGELCDVSYDCLD